MEEIINILNRIISNPNIVKYQIKDVSLIHSPQNFWLNHWIQNTVSCYGDILEHHSVQISRTPSIMLLWISPMFHLNLKICHGGSGVFYHNISEYNCVSSCAISIASHVKYSPTIETFLNRDY